MQLSVGHYTWPVVLQFCLLFGLACMLASPSLESALMLIALCLVLVRKARLEEDWLKFDNVVSCGYCCGLICNGFAVFFKMVEC